MQPDIKEINVNYGGYSGKDNEIDMATRSMLQIMLEFSTLVRVPASDVTPGRAAPGLVDTQADQPQDKAAMKVLSGDAQARRTPLFRSNMAGGGSGSPIRTFSPNRPSGP